MPGLLGNRPSRHFKIYRTRFPAIFRFNGRLYQEEYDIDFDEHRWIEIDEESAQRWLNGERKQFETIEHEHGVLTINHGPVEPFIPEGGEERQTHREEFEQQFGPIVDEQWQWLKEFCKRHPVTGGE